MLPFNIDSSSRKRIIALKLNALLSDFIFHCFLLSVSIAPRGWFLYSQSDSKRTDSITLCRCTCFYDLSMTTLNIKTVKTLQEEGEQCKLHAYAARVGREQEQRKASCDRERNAMNVAARQAAKHADVQAKAMTHTAKQSDVVCKCVPEQQGHRHGEATKTETNRSCCSRPAQSGHKPSAHVSSGSDRELSAKMTHRGRPESSVAAVENTIHKQLN